MLDRILFITKRAKFPFGSGWVFTGVFLLFFAPQFYQWLTMQFEWHDLGHVYRILINGAKSGQFFSYDWQMDHMKIHFTPFFYILAPLMSFLNHAGWFLVLHTIAIAVATICLFHIAKVEFDPTDARRGGFVVAALFVCNPYTWAIHLYPHYEIFGFTAFLGFAAALKSGRRVVAMVCLAVALTVKEDFWFYALGVCVVLVNRQNWKVIGACVTAIGLYYLVVLGLIRNDIAPPVNSVPQVWNFANDEFDILRFYRDRPEMIFDNLTNQHFLTFLAPFGFLLLLSPVRLLPLLATALIWLCSTDINRNSLGYYYSLPLVLLGFLLLPKCLHRWIELLARWSKSLKIGVIDRQSLWVSNGAILVVIALCMHATTPSGLALGPHLKKVFSVPYEERHRYLHRLIRHEIPNTNQTSVFTQFSLAPYQPTRADLYISFQDDQKLLDGAIQPDLVLLDLKGFSYQGRPPSAINHELYHFHGSRYELTHHLHDVYLYKKK